MPEGAEVSALVGRQRRTCRCPGAEWDKARDPGEALIGKTPVKGTITFPTFRFVTLKIHSCCVYLKKGTQGTGAPRLGLQRGAARQTLQTRIRLTSLEGGRVELSRSMESTSQLAGRGD